MRRTMASYAAALSLFLTSMLCAGEPRLLVLDPGALSANLSPDADWLRNHIPWFECPDPQIQEIYYFRWRVFKKHLQKTPDGYVVTEFLPRVSWAGKHNTISCAAGHHFREGRWLHDARYLDDYAVFWFRKGGEPRRYSFWAADALYSHCLVHPNAALLTGLLPDLVANYRAWEASHQDPSGLFWQSDDRDGMEFSIGGSGYRPTINAYQYGDAVAIARIADLAGRRDLAETYRQKAAQLKTLVQARLWDKQAQFFKTLPRGQGARLVDVREEIGFVPWYFGLPARGYEAAWKQLLDPEGFCAPFGPTTAERRHPWFMAAHRHDCLWNGPSWPYATTQTLVALANLLHDYPQDFVGKKDYLTVLRNYARSQYKEGKPWIAEDLDGLTGRWIVDLPRSADYNHSGYADLIITGLVGLRPRADDLLEVHPLVPENTWAYFCLDNVSYHGHRLTILYDRTGQRYHKGTGLRVFADGKQVAVSEALGRVTARLPALARGPAADKFPAAESAGWRAYEHNPVLGGKLGTCFDVALVREGGKYRMWFSWRPRRSIALVESADGMHWSEPVLVLGPNPASGWEDEVNRPVVVKRDNGYHLWYTGQAKGHSWIGYATSPDGKTWTRISARPVLTPEQKWEKVAVMCPHVLWDEERKLYRLWYSGGAQYEPDAIGYATSPDGKTWTRGAKNPIFTADPRSVWDQHKVTAGQVVRRGDWHYLFYIGFRDVHHAQIGLARSRDGITGWERHPGNPIIRPGKDRWDADAVYKPFALFDGTRWLLWYNGRRGHVEQIGLAIHAGEDLGF